MEHEMEAGMMLETCGANTTSVIFTLSFGPSPLQ